jgi:CDP-paratose 2-epimerase
VGDLIKLFEITVDNIDKASGKIFNVGGGPKNILAVWNTFGPILEKLFAKKISVKFSDWRPGDQKVYISDIRFVEKVLGWKPIVGVAEGIEKLYKWVITNKELFNKFV